MRRSPCDVITTKDHLARSFTPPPRHQNVLPTHIRHYAFFLSLSLRVQCSDFGSRGSRNLKHNVRHIFWVSVIRNNYYRVKFVTWDQKFSDKLSCAIGSEFGSTGNGWWNIENSELHYLCPFIDRSLLRFAAAMTLVACRTILSGIRSYLVCYLWLMKMNYDRFKMVDDLSEIVSCISFKLEIFQRLDH